VRPPCSAYLRRNNQAWLVRAVLLRPDVDLSFGKIRIFSEHWTSLFTPDTVGLMIHALLAFVSIFASTFRHRQGLVLENLALRQQLPFTIAAIRDRNYAHKIVSSGSGYPKSGVNGAQPS
jgi:hypothetical protein